MGIRLENVCYTYGSDTTSEIKALNNVNLEINKGEFVAIIGHTGSGKSTLIQHLTDWKDQRAEMYFIIMKIYMKIIMICENLDAKSGLFFNIRSISYLKKQCLKMSVSAQ